MKRCLVQIAKRPSFLFGSYLSSFTGWSKEIKGSPETCIYHARGIADSSSFSQKLLWSLYPLSPFSVFSLNRTSSLNPPKICVHLTNFAIWSLSWVKRDNEARRWVNSTKRCNTPAIFWSECMYYQKWALTKLLNMGVLKVSLDYCGFYLHQDKGSSSRGGAARFGGNVQGWTTSHPRLVLEELFVWDDEG